MADVSFPLSAEEALAQLRVDLNETAVKFWSDQQLSDFIVRGCMDVSTKTHCVQATASVPVVATQLEYDDQANHLENIAIRYKPAGEDADSRSLRRINPRAIGHLDMSDPGLPFYWYQFAKKIGVWPMSTAAMVSAGDTLNVYYSKSTGAITDLPDEFQPLALLYAKYLALKKDKKHGSASQVMAEYVNLVNFYRADLIDSEPSDMEV